MKRLFTIALALILIVGILPMTGHAAGYLESGLRTVPKLTQEELKTLMTQDRVPAEVFDRNPVNSVPYIPGKVSDEALQKALNRLNALRRVAGLESVALDPVYNENCQHGAVLLSAYGTLDHHPPKPDDMGCDFYERAYENTSTSNIAWMTFKDNINPLADAVDMFMEDSDSSNVTRLGHRRWQLSRRMGKVGLGCAVQNVAYGKYRYYFATEYVQDQSGSASGDYDFIGWPASGLFPESCFGADYAWSIQLNTEKYQLPALADLTVTLEHGGRSWTLSGADSYQAADSGAYLAVESSGFGFDGGCIIFRPESPGLYMGVYTVTVQGIRDLSGNPVDFSYQVEFVDPTGKPHAGWWDQGGSRFYFDGAGQLVTGWQDIDGWRYYFTPEGRMMTGWMDLDGSRYYLGYDGKMRTGASDCNGKVYGFDDEGRLITGGGIYYLRSGWYWTDSAGNLIWDYRWFCLDSEGAVQYGWQEIDGKHYYFDSRGWRKDGWLDYGNDRYYFDDNGVMLTGLQNLYGDWYYFGDDGAMRTGWQTIDGRDYFFDDQGRLDESAVKPVELFRLLGTNVIMGNNLDMMFAIPGNAVSDWTGCWAEIVRTYADGASETVKLPFEQWEPNGENYTVTYRRLAAKEMTDELTVTVYSADGRALSEAWTDSIRSYAMRLLGKSQSAEQKTMIVDMLGYGAAAQSHFGYNAADPADQLLTPEQKQLASTLQPLNQLERGEKVLGSNLILESNIRLLVAMNGLTPDMSAQVSFTDHLGRAHAFTVPGSDFVLNHGVYTIYVDGLVIADGRQTVTVEIRNADGSLYTTAKESIEDYVSRLIEKDSLDPLNESIMKFADSAYACLHAAK